MTNQPKVLAVKVSLIHISRRVDTTPTAGKIERFRAVVGNPGGLHPSGNPLAIAARGETDEEQPVRNANWGEHGMRLHLHLALVGALAMAGLNSLHAQTPGPIPPPPAPAATAPPELPTPDVASTIDSQMAALAQNAAALQKQQATAGAVGAQDLPKQVEILRQQVETQQKMIQLLMKQVKEQPAGGAAVQQLEVQTATLEARGRQAAQRDEELARGLDTVADHQDSMERYGPFLPSKLKELFLPSGNNETPLTISGALSAGYSHILGDATTAANGAGRPSTPGGFYFGEFSPDFFLKLNDWIFLEAEIAVTTGGTVTATFAQADFLVNDWLTITAGKFVAPIGWYNLRLNNPWVNKLPTDTPGAAPLPWLQVLPPLSMLGVQAQGAFYLGCSPIKMEYNAYVSNGLNLTPAAAGMPTINELANLENMEDAESIITNDKAIGGRLGLWWPEVGLEGGVSGMVNGDYVAGGFEDSISLMAVDLNYHKGDWDVRAEYGMTWQHTDSFAGTPGLVGNIRRRGLYGQVAYRPREAPNKYLQNTELVYRYGYVDFRGIDTTMLDLTTFASPIDVPVRRNQNEFGINYWFYPRLVLKCAYQVNTEPGFHLHDNQFIAELDWGW
jgi:hypothetical protein